MTYKFEQFNTEITDPIVDINPIVRNINPIAMTIDVDITLSVEGAKFGIDLNNIPVQNLVYTSESLTERVMEHLTTFSV